MALTDLTPLCGMTYGQMRCWAADHCDATIGSALLPPQIDGYYDDRERAIVIDRGMCYTRKRCALVHELVHWVHGDRFVNMGFALRAERRARRETASILVSEAEYATAENIYEGDVAAIAEELDVTEGVVRDYQELVLSVSLFR